MSATWERALQIVAAWTDQAREIAICSHSNDPLERHEGVPREWVCMPLYWTIDLRNASSSGVAKATVTLADAMALLDALAGAGALPYRKLFDARAVQSAMTTDDVLALSAKIRAYHGQGPVGALAIVGTDEQFDTFARLLGALAAADRPMETNLRQARNWLNQQTA